MSRVQRASIAASFTYLQFGLTIIVGIVMVPFVLDRVGVRLYGYWLASGEVLAYAAMADLGVLGVIPWMIAQADGRKDRDRIRELLSTGFVAAIIVSALYLALVVLLWNVAPAVLKLEAAERQLIAGPLALMAGVTAIVLPMRVASSALLGLQDVRYCGVMTTVAWALDAALTIALLLNGFGLWALAVGASVAAALNASAAIVRLRAIAPDLVESWPRPSRQALARLFKEGGGGWLSAWGWRLASATDAIVVASLGFPVWVTILAMTTKLGQMLTNMAWVPGDSGLVGLAQLAGEGDPGRVRAAIGALGRVYLTLATVAACVVLAANPSFVKGWVGAELFAGVGTNALLALVVIGATAAHALSAAVSVLGKRLYVGVTTLVAGAAHVVLAYVLGRRFGLAGIPLAALLVQLFILIPALLPALRTVSGITFPTLMRSVVAPWVTHAVPLLGVAAAIGIGTARVPIWMAVPLGALAGVVALFVSRRLILDYPPVTRVIRARLAILGLDGVLLTNPPQQPNA
jgi:O-antigen/teichoic acid export membrane protein